MVGLEEEGTREGGKGGGRASPCLCHGGGDMLLVGVVAATAAAAPGCEVSLAGLHPCEALADSDGGAETVSGMQQLRLRGGVAAPSPRPARTALDGSHWKIGVRKIGRKIGPPRLSPADLP